jgi:hypothetical protein
LGQVDPAAQVKKGLSPAEWSVESITSVISGMAYRIARWMPSVRVA